MSREIDSRSTRMPVVVLAGRKLRDHDRILLLLGRDHGRLDAVAAGARKPGNRFQGMIEPFSFLDASLYRKPGGELWTLRDATVVAASPQLTSWQSTLALQAAAELLVHGGPGEGAEREGYTLARAFHQEISAALDPVAVLSAFALAWSRASGFGEPRVEGAGTNVSGVRRFLERSASDPIDCWRRYRPRDTVRSALMSVVRDHIETHTDKAWKGMRILGAE
jgi:hypothetical protein